MVVQSTITTSANLACCYNFVSGLSGGKRTRRPLDASSSTLLRSVIVLKFNFDWLLFMIDPTAPDALVSCSLTSWNSNGGGTASLMGLMASMSSVWVSMVFMPDSNASSEATSLFWSRISAANDSRLPTAGHAATSETFCHKTWRRFLRLMSFGRLRDGSAREKRKNFFSLDGRVALLVFVATLVSVAFCGGRWPSNVIRLLSSGDDDAVSSHGGGDMLFSLKLLLFMMPNDPSRNGPSDDFFTRPFSISASSSSSIGEMFPTTVGTSVLHDAAMDGYIMLT